MIITTLFFFLMFLVIFQKYDFSTDGLCTLFYNKTCSRRIKNELRNEKTNLGTFSFSGQKLVYRLIIIIMVIIILLYIITL